MSRSQSPRHAAEIIIQATQTNERPPDSKEYIRAVIECDKKAANAQCKCTHLECTAAHFKSQLAHNGEGVAKPACKGYVMCERYYSQALVESAVSAEEASQTAITS